MPRQIFQLRISLSGVRPTIWRRVLVPGGYTLDRLHRVVQHAMGWRDCHLHSFEIDGVQYGEPDPDGDLALDDELPLHDELDVRLDAVAGKGSRLQYTYDFGDWWEHDLLVEDVVTADADERYPRCVDGERAAPPENVGGAQGYLLLLAAVADPGHPEHAAMRAWVGDGFDPEAFDAGRVTTLLRRFC
ncbi:plasmid pRiA4b ORF-3 family protein [Micromonospora fiedleri]|uniref:Plasmid pRiA4b ORF-3 family protein n=1 Tax=Micromonospora fiedleri TaxID=1157498 RepID=A0ABS1UE39_9ACTN|nr:MULTISPECIES: plasmid pRiA4b ORF-3 family protein [Micromonospora]MBL6274616.1 plasmid pRiA4b ORF-3 family protein [Micromonospora fiedleri]WSK44666.1 plasmid pRiA4b ORF-3 family protein [Micromonospora maris]